MLIFVSPKSKSVDIPHASFNDVYGHSHHRGEFAFNRVESKFNYTCLIISVTGKKYLFCFIMDNMPLHVVFFLKHKIPLIQFLLGTPHSFVQRNVNISKLLPDTPTISKVDSNLGLLFCDL